MKKSSTEQANSWLQRLKDESWEAELLISAVAIFGTLELFKGVDWVVNLFIDSLQPDQYLVGYAIAFGGLLAISILTTMFVIHFSLRAYWVGLVGLNSVFPDYGLEDSVYSKIYTEKMLGILPKLKNTVQQVDEICSVIYSAAFFMLLIYLYLSLVASLYLFLFNTLSPYVNGHILLIPVYLIIIMLVLQMILGTVANLKAYKQNKKMQLWYFHISKWGSILAYGPLYKQLMQIAMTFASNFRKKKSLVGLTITFIVIGFIITMIQFENSKMPYLVNQEFYFDDTRVHHGYYASKTTAKEFLLGPQIESDIIDKNIIPLFIPVYKHERKQYQPVCGEFEKNDSQTLLEQRRERSAWYLNCYHTYHQVFLNGKKVDTDFMKYELPVTNQFGLLNYINLEGAKEGKNTIKVIKDIGDNPYEWTIPFQYISN